MVLNDYVNFSKINNTTEPPAKTTSPHLSTLPSDQNLPARSPSSSPDRSPSSSPDRSPSSSPTRSRSRSPLRSPTTYTQTQSMAHPQSKSLEFGFLNLLSDPSLSLPPTIPDRKLPVYSRNHASHILRLFKGKKSYGAIAETHLQGNLLLKAKSMDISFCKNIARMAINHVIVWINLVWLKPNKLFLRPTDWKLDIIQVSNALLTSKAKSWHAGLINMKGLGLSEEITVRGPSFLRLLPTGKYVFCIILPEKVKVNPRYANSSHLFMLSPSKT
jgi:hypothetical protein